MNFKGSMLLDESVSLGDISTSSFGTPLPVKGSPNFEDSPVAQPQFIVKDDESEDGQEDSPPSPLDDMIPVGSVEADEDVAPRSSPDRDRTPSPKAHPEPRTPSRRPKIQITMEMEGIVVSAQRLRPRCAGSRCSKAKIWATIGDLIQPGYQHPGEGKTLRAKETLYAPLPHLHDKR